MRLLAFTHLWSFIAAIGLLCTPAGGVTYFVATTGADTNCGTSLETPFRTIQHAAALLGPGDTCYLRGGIYRETIAPARSGTSNAPIIFDAYSNEVVTVSGADVVSGWQLYSAGIYCAAFDGDLGNGYNQVFVDGALMHQARYPNFGPGDLFHPATAGVSVGGSQNNVITSSAFSGHPDNYWAGAWFSGGIDVRWSWQSARVVSSSGSTITVDPATMSNPWFGGSGSGFAWGLQSLLDGDNEWHLSCGTPRNTLYVRLAGAANPTAHTIEIKRRPWCVNLSGRSYITVRRLQLRAGAVWLKGNGNVLENCRARFSSHYMTYIWGYSFDGGLPQGGAVVIDGTNNTVCGCTISDTAGSGVISRGSDNIIKRNVIYNTDYSGTYACGIRLEGLRDQVSYNTVHDSGRDILQPAGAAHAICFNNFYRPALMCQDTGVLYIWGVNAQAGGVNTRIAYNWFHDNLGPGATPLIYLDNWCRNFALDHNVCWNSGGDSGLRINAPAAGHLIYNNTLFYCEDIGTHTYDMWPNNNPDPAFWTRDCYQYSAANNLFLGASPETQLTDWSHADFRLKPNSPAIDTGVSIPGWTDFFPIVGAVDKGACESGSLAWRPGADGWCQPKLSVTYLNPGLVKLTAPAGAAYFQLLMATNPVPPVVWIPVTNAPSVSANDWSLTLAIPTNQHSLFRLQGR